MKEVTTQGLDLRLSQREPLKRAFREFTTHICPPADFALLILKTAVIRTDSYRLSTVRGAFKF